MAAGSAQREGAEFFTAPDQVNHRRYEALRAFFVDGLTHEQAGERVGYTRWAMVNLVRDYRAGKLNLFAPARKPGPPAGIAPAKDREGPPSPPTPVQRRFLDTPGQIIITTADTITIRLNRRAYSPVLRQADLPGTAVPWWGNRTLHYEYA